MKTFVLNGNNFSDMESFYDEVQRVLCPRFNGFGRNLDAFNDVLRGGFLAFEYGERIKLVWENSEKSRKDLGYPELLKNLQAGMKRAHPSNLPYYEKSIKDAEHARGQTLFDGIVEIIKGHSHIEFELR